jgi:hypothetical protein
MGSLFRGLKNLIGAMLLIAAALCATEVGLRAHRWYRLAYTPAAALESHTDALVVPSAVTYQELRPLSAIVLHEGDADREVLVRTNSFGLRGPEITLPKPAGVYRVLCLGGESTLGLDLPEEETYCARLQQRLQRYTRLEVEVVNAGLPGGCPLTALLFLRHRLLGMQPDVVLLHLDASAVADDRAARPYVYVDASGAPVAAVNPLCESSGSSPVGRLSEEFALVDCLRQRLGKAWEESTRDEAQAAANHDDAAGPAHDVRPSRLLVQQALNPLTEIRRLLAGAYCELVVTTLENTFDDVLDDPGGPMEAGTPSNPAAAPQTLAESLAGHGILYLNAAGVRGDASGGRRAALNSAAEHDGYAAAQADFVVAHVPGVWTDRQSPEGLQPLPGVARSPRGVTE